MACPSDDDLSSYLVGRVPSTDAAVIAAHVADCRMCEALVEVLGTRPGSLASGSTEVAPLGSAATVAAGAPRPFESAPTIRATPTKASTPGTHVIGAGDSVGDYVLQRRVGAGGMGVVWEAYDPALDRTVAIKLMRDAAQHLRTRFDQEVRITARLQHPSIVNIFEAGTWQGEPYYVMKLVRGESLDVKIGGAAGVAARLAMLPAVIAVVDALAYAHGAQVIHRDLKPENILVGEFGEAVVIDWGLAKQLGTRGSMPHIDAASSGETSAGSVLGTPAYMPPEQARGERVDARADVYALGAILYFMLGGQRPYAGSDPSVLVASVIAGPPSSLRGELPAELETIVAKAMARDPAARYPTARELAEDLKRFQTGQLVASHHYSARDLLARWIRRHRTAVAVGGIATLVLAVSGGVGVRRILQESERATAAQISAVEQRTEVEKLLTTMLGNVRKQLAPIGKVAVLEKIATQAEAYFESPRAAGSDQHQRFRALLAVGDVLMSKSNTPAALDKYRAAERLARMHFVMAPHDRQWRRDVAEADSKVGMAHRQLGNLPAAIGAFREQHALLLALSAEDPADDRDRDLSASHDVLGSMMWEQGDLPGAVLQFRAGLALDERILARAPNDTDRMRAFALTHMKVGMASAAQGDYDGALIELRIATATMEKVVAAEPEAQEHLRDMAVFRGKVAMVLTAKKDNAGALAEHKASLELMRKVAKREPANARYQADVANELSYVASLVKTHSYAEALVYCQEARVIRDALVARDPTNVEWQANMLASSQQTSLVLLQLDRAAEALGHARAAVDIGKALVARDPTKIEWQKNLIQCHAAVADIQDKLGKRDEAIAAQRLALTIAEHVLSVDENQPESHRDVADRHEQIGSLLWASDRKAAEIEYRTALAIFDHLAATYPQNPEWAESARFITTKLATPALRKRRR